MLNLNKKFRTSLREQGRLVKVLAEYLYTLAYAYTTQR